MLRPPIWTAVAATLTSQASRLIAVGAVSLLATSLTGAAAASDQLVLTEQLERATFRAADRDGDGLLDETELAADSVAAFVQLDTNADGVLDPEELTGISEAAFSRIDIDGDGAISVAELRLRKLNDFAAADRDLDGRVSMAEMLFRPRRAPL
jgi:Ca2+-binding EF-hand superfamily protein